MKQIPPIKSVMTPFPYTVEIDESALRAREIMAEHEIRHLAVVEDGRLVGMLTERDVARPAAAGPRVRDVCAREPYIVGLSEPLDRVLLEMAGRHVDAVLVVKERKLVGIFTLTDACETFAGFLRSLFPTGDGEDAA